MISPKNKPLEIVHTRNVKDLCPSESLLRSAILMLAPQGLEITQYFADNHLENFDHDLIIRAVGKVASGLLRENPLLTRSDAFLGESSMPPLQILALEHLIDCKAYETFSEAVDVIVSNEQADVFPHIDLLIGRGLREIESNFEALPFTSDIFKLIDFAAVSGSRSTLELLKDSLLNESLGVLYSFLISDYIQTDLKLVSLENLISIGEQRELPTFIIKVLNDVLPEFGGKCCDGYLEDQGLKKLVIDILNDTKIPLVDRQEFLSFLLQAKEEMRNELEVYFLVAARFKPEYVKTVYRQIGEVAISHFFSELMKSEGAQGLYDVSAAKIISHISNKRKNILSPKDDYTLLSILARESFNSKRHNEISENGINVILTLLDKKPKLLVDRINQDCNEEFDLGPILLHLSYASPMASKTLFERDNLHDRGRFLLAWALGGTCYDTELAASYREISLEMYFGENHKTVDAELLRHVVPLILITKYFAFQSRDFLSVFEDVFFRRSVECLMLDKHLPGQELINLVDALIVESQSLGINEDSSREDVYGELRKYSQNLKRVISGEIKYLLPLRLDPKSLDRVIKDRLIIESCDELSTFDPICLFLAAPDDHNGGLANTSLCEAEMFEKFRTLYFIPRDLPELFEVVGMIKKKFKDGFPIIMIDNHGHTSGGDFGGGQTINHAVATFLGQQLKLSEGGTFVLSSCQGFYGGRYGESMLKAYLRGLRKNAVSFTAWGSPLECYSPQLRNVSGEGMNNDAVMVPQNPQFRVLRAASTTTPLETIKFYYGWLVGCIKVRGHRIQKSLVSSHS